MNHIIIGGHGQLATGFKSALEVIYGETDHVHFFNAYSEGARFPDDFRSFVTQIPAADDIVLVSDIFGGSVNTEFMRYYDQENVTIVTGGNLMLILGLITSQDVLDKQHVQSIIDEVMELTGIIEIPDEIEEESLF